ncbi:hypothetical protein V5799_026241 [Amblyomma americanum]|uniref:Uncharacterized protein n=1 Tax=Amblyomma americanum TaxID=6943 RepID=A0AAQ4DJ51_AMBAM
MNDSLFPCFYRLLLLLQNAALAFSSDVVTPCLAPGNQLTGPPFVFSTKYFQTIAGALNLTETCLSTVLFNSLCSRSEESLSAVLFTFSFAYSIAGLYMLLNGVCNSPLPSGDTSPGHRSGLMTPTRVGNSVSVDSSPDLTFCKNALINRWLNTGNTLGSDHYILATTLSTSPYRRKGRPSLITDWDKFRSLRAQNAPTRINNLDEWISDLQADIRNHLSRLINPVQTAVSST